MARKFRVEAIDPEQAFRQASDVGLVVHSMNPLNCETPIQRLGGCAVAPNGRFYIRNHFPIPKLDAATYRLSVGGLVERPLSLALSDLQNLRAQSLTVALECAGNGRALFDKPVKGERWALGAVGAAEWSGLPLVDILERAGVKSTAREVVFRGADGGVVDGYAEPIRFERSLPLDQARGAGRLLAYSMNGEPLPVEHGYPVRLVVADWYGMASVKWLTEVELIDRPFAGLYQAQEYCYEWEVNGQVIREPATLQRVRALITDPVANQEIECGELVVRGLAWSGSGPIAQVEVSVGNRPWQEAHLIGRAKPHSWTPWELTICVLKPGALTFRARAADLAGHTQPEVACWNRRGYGNNMIHPVQVVLRAAKVS
jgi:DMSO/TMAO reductase YedYZ molybdopterin-dependent catalytic subunit